MKQIFTSSTQLQRFFPNINAEYDAFCASYPKQLKKEIAADVRAILKKYNSNAKVQFRSLYAYIATFPVSDSNAAMYAEIAAVVKAKYTVAKYHFYDSRKRGSDFDPTQQFSPSVEQLQYFSEDPSKFVVAFHLGSFLFAKFHAHLKVIIHEVVA